MDTQMTQAQPPFTAASFRYSDEPAAMRRFLDILGLDVAVSHGDTWFEMHGRGGVVCLHRTGNDSPATGGSMLVMITDDARSAANHVQSRDVSATVWDESYGRHARMDHPLGRDIWINEWMSDFYGYQRHDPRPGPIDIVTVFFTDDFPAAIDFFAIFGFTPHDEGTATDWQTLRNGDRGIIGLHVPDAERTAGTTAMSFETAEDLRAVAERLRANGFIPEFRSAPDRIEVTDPDGVRVEVHRVMS